MVFYKGAFVALGIAFREYGAFAAAFFVQFFRNVRAKGRKQFKEFARNVFEIRVVARLVALELVNCVQ